jgi:hypothetical protein
MAWPRSERSRAAGGRDAAFAQTVRSWRCTSRVNASSERHTPIPTWSPRCSLSLFFLTRRTSLQEVLSSFVHPIDVEHGRTAAASSTAMHVSRRLSRLSDRLAGRPRPCSAATRRPRHAPWHEWAPGLWPVTVFRLCAEPVDEFVAQEPDLSPAGEPVRGTRPSPPCAAGTQGGRAASRRLASS